MRTNDTKQTEYNTQTAECDSVQRKLAYLMKKADERISDLKLELKDALDDLEVGDCVGWRNQISMREQLEVEDESLEDKVGSILGIDLSYPKCLSDVNPKINLKCVKCDWVSAEYNPS